MPRLSDDEYDRKRDAAIFAALKTGDPGPLKWTKHFPHDWPNKSGSDNVAAEKNALRLFRPETRTLALVKWRPGGHAEREQEAFENIEYGSRIYRSRTLIAHLLAYRWAASPDGFHRDGPLFRFLEDWLRLYWTLELLASVHLRHGVQSMRIGARSAGHPLHPIQSDYALSLALGEPFSWVKPWRFLGPQNKQAEGALARQLQALTPEIDASCPEELVVHFEHGGIGTLVEQAPKWGVLATTHYYRTAAGVAVWVEEQSGGNTVGISAAGADEGGEPWCIGPSPKAWAGKERAWRQKPYRLECLSDGKQLIASGEVAGQLLPVETHYLPAGEPVYHVVHGPEGLRRIA